MNPVRGFWRLHVPMQPDSSPHSWANPLHGETLGVVERLIVAPTIGAFRSSGVHAGAVLSTGDEIGTVEGPGSSTPVLSPFDGDLMGMMAEPGERVVEGQPVAWLRAQ